jgi:hypothetical protein
MKHEKKYKIVVNIKLCPTNKKYIKKVKNSSLVKENDKYSVKVNEEII